MKTTFDDMPGGGRRLHSSTIHVGELVRQELRCQRRSASWLAAGLFCDRTNVYRIFRSPRMDTELLLRLSQILQHDFFADISRLLSEETD